jgi:hypothetical protein
MIAAVVEQFDVVASTVRPVEPNDARTFQQFTIYNVCEHFLSIVE